MFHLKAVQTSELHLPSDAMDEIEHRDESSSAPPHWDRLRSEIPWADSSKQRNDLSILLRRRTVARCLSGSAVERSFDPFKIPFRTDRKIGSFGNVSA